jgi:predicted membrane channel-forming protein YqfA (hemolysin III family)
MELESKFGLWRRWVALLLTLLLEFGVIGAVVWFFWRIWKPLEVVAFLLGGLFVVASISQARHTYKTKFERLRKAI